MLACAALLLAAACSPAEPPPVVDPPEGGLSSVNPMWKLPTQREDGPARCKDGLDNDGDGYFDCKDYGCRPQPFCDRYEDSEAECRDGIDNDGDGYTDCDDYGCKKSARCKVSRTVRVASFNVQYLGSSTSSGFAALRKVITRVGADVICLQEVKDYEGYRFIALAKATGYPHWFQGKVSTPMAGGLTNACLSKFPVVQGRSRSSDDISPHSWANETGRDIVTVRVKVPTLNRHLLVVNAHLKSGFKDADRVRRQVEMLRIRDILRQHRKAHPGDAVVVLGDFNEELDGATLGWIYQKAPWGMPYSYALGKDLSYPITYHPFAVLKAEGLKLTDPTHEDSTTAYGTRIPSGKRIDFLYYRGAELSGDEVYEACADNGKDDAPAGHYLNKKGAGPLPCGTSYGASDHRPVMADLKLRNP